MTDAIKSKADRFFTLATEQVEIRPWLVVILMHEYYRNLYATDPHLPFSPGSSHLVRIDAVLDKAVGCLEAFEFSGSYFKDNPDWRTSVLAHLGSRSVAPGERGGNAAGIRDSFGTSSTRRPTSSRRTRSWPIGVPAARST